MEKAVKWIIMRIVLDVLSLILGNLFLFFVYFNEIYSILECKWPILLTFAVWNTPLPVRRVRPVFEPGLVAYSGVIRMICESVL